VQKAVYKLCCWILALYTLAAVVMALFTAIVGFASVDWIEAHYLPDAPSGLLTILMILGFWGAVFGAWSVVVVPVSLLAILTRSTERHFFQGQHSAAGAAAFVDQKRSSAPATASPDDLSRYKF